MSSELIFWIVVIAVAVISLLIHTYIDNAGIDDIEDVLDTLLDSGGWITVLVVLSIGGLVFGFVFWKWWIMALIIAGIIVIVVIIFKFLLGYDDTSCETESEQVKTKHKCSNCGANIKKIVTEDEYGDKKVIYKCDYCGVVYTKKDLVLGVKTEKVGANYEGIDLTDFEEEYFDACDRFFYKPYNHHTDKRIDAKYEMLTNEINFGNKIYKDIEWYKSKDVLEAAYNFLTENEDEIKEYLSKTNESEIKRRYEFYTLLNTDDTDEENEDDE